MRAIFYDLETTDLNCVGQILNYAFIEVDEEYNVKSTLRGKIKINRTQLPQPGAIIANRVDVLEQQKQATETEAEAMSRIHEYIYNINCNHERVIMVGWNSGTFDLQFLRTSMIRNGVVPYMKGLENRDLKYFARVVTGIDPNVRAQLKEMNVPHHHALEVQCKVAGIMFDDEEQLHESFDDTLKTIAVAKHYKDTYGLCVFKFEPNMMPISGGKTNAIFKRTYFEFETLEEKTEHVIMLKQDSKKKYMILLCLEKFAQNLSDLQDAPTLSTDLIRSCAYSYNREASCVMVQEVKNPSDVFVELAELGRKIFAHVTVDDFYPPKTCDVEQHIYMLPFDEMRALCRAIDLGDLSELKRLDSKLGAKLYVRYLLNKNIKNEKEHDMVADRLKKYAIYRYGGDMRTRREGTNEFKYIESADKLEFIADGSEKDYHPLYTEMVRQAENFIATGTESDKKLMESLLQFYKDSFIYQCAGEELEHRVLVEL